ncbi:hypothetical protein KA405_05900 [Patescibacteria group bacterium]|nr:hypothetical protein [Patescibacteria group bacterium]
MHTSELKNNDERFENEYQKSPVTNIDQEVEQFIKNSIREKFPHH